MFQKKNYRARLYDPKEKLPVVHDRRSLLITIILLALIIIFRISYPGPLMVIERIFQWVGLPTHSGENGMGWHYANLFLLVLLGIVFFFMDRALNRSRFIAFIVIMLLMSSAPGWLTTTYQHIFATGVYAMDVDRSLSSCNYVVKDRKLTGTCQLKLKNSSKDQVEVVPSVEPSKMWGGSSEIFPVITLSSIVVLPRTNGIHITEFNIEVDTDAESSGSIGGDMSIILNDGAHERHW